MSPETIDKLKEVFSPVAQKIGEGAQFGWEVVVRQQIVEGIVAAVWVVVGVVVLIVGLYCSKKLYDKHKEKEKKQETGEYRYSHNSDWIFVSILVGVISIMSSVFFIGNLGTAITHLVNPEFYAIQFFLELVK